MTCRELIEFLMAYFDGELDEPQKAEFERHLEICPPCVAYLRTYQETVRLGKTVGRHPDDSVPPEVPEELVKAILSARARAGG